jgi:threonine 3-dehydrogenase
MPTTPIPDTMTAVVKPAAAPGAEVRQVPVPEIGPHDVLIKVKVASICGTDLHIYDWDPWAQHRIKPPLIPGHEFCGNVVAIGGEVTSVSVGDFVSAEMHVACGKCYQCRIGEAHICQNVKILGVDDAGAFAEYVRIPEPNVWKLDPSISPEYASILDPLGNAVNTVLSGEIAGRSIAVIGCGPIGLFAIAVARACGASQIFALEPNESRRELAHTMDADFALDPTKDDVRSIVMQKTGGIGVDVVAEMSGHPSGINMGFKLLRFGGRVSLLGTPTRPVEMNLADDVIFKGATVHGIHGRLMYKTWFQMQGLLKAKRLNLDPVITDKLPLKDFSQGMEKLKTGKASKILVYPNGVK